MNRLKAVYHRALALLGVLIYRFPSRQIKVVGVTGTKGKTTTVEIVDAILTEAGFITALSSTLRFKIAARSGPNLRKMTMPGRFFLQRFLRQAVKAGCDWAILEMTSEGARQFRHRFIDLDALIFTNLAPEHIESHGSFEKYRQAKLDIARQLARSAKPRRVLIVNGDDAAAEHFLAVTGPTAGPEKIVYRLSDAEPWDADERGGRLTIAGQTLISLLPGRFNLYNILAAVAFARSQNIALAAVAEALRRLPGVRGRMEEVGRQKFAVIVDYAHTPDSLRQVYETLGSRRKLCVLGACGGGRDRWKRPVLGQIASEHCAEIIITDEDPYNEDPAQIAAEIKKGVSERKPCQIILDRRLAIREALKRARAGDAVVITGKGTDPYIMGPRGKKTPWSDAAVAHEELERLYARTAGS